MADMNRLADIPVRVEGDAPDGAQAEGGMAEAIVGEVAQHLARLVESGEAGAIDLQSMPMTEADKAALREALGEGEVEATVQVIGPTRIHETGYPGVWWIQHMNAEEHVVAEQLEIARVPGLLSAHEADVRAALQRLRARTQDEG